MTRIEGKEIIIEVEKPDKCEYCGRTEELRPYGPGGARICYDCGTATPEMKKIVAENFDKILDQVDVARNAESTIVIELKK